MSKSSTLFHALPELIGRDTRLARYELCDTLSLLEGAERTGDARRNLYRVAITQWNYHRHIVFSY